MKKLKNILLIVFMAAFMIPFCVNATNEKPEANKEPVKVYIFRSNSCHYCIDTMNFLEEKKEEYGDYYEVVDYEVSNRENSKLHEEVMTFMGDQYGGSVPYLVVGKYTYPRGFDPASKISETETMGDQLIQRILEVYQSDNRYDVMIALKNKPDYSIIVGIGAIVLVIGLTAVAVISRRQNS